MGEETLVAMPLAPHHHHAHLPALPHLAAPPPPPPSPAEPELTREHEEDDPADGVVEPALDVPRREALIIDGGDVGGGEDVYYARKMLQGVVLRPPPHLPQPEAPPGLTRALSAPDGYVEEEEEQRHVERSASVNSAASAVVVDVASIGRFFRDRRDVLSSAITRRISSLKEGSSPPPVGMDTYGVQEIHLPNVKVTVRLKDAIEADAEEDAAAAHHGGGDDGYSFSGSHIKGQVSFFSRSGCRDCAAVRAFFRQSALPYVEINLDVFPEREAEFASRAGASARVPQIFLNEKLLGGLVVLNSLRNSGEFERRVRDLAGRRCPDAAPRVPVYGFDDPGKEDGDRDDAMVGIVRVLRHRLPIQDRIVRLKLVKNCFSGADMVDGIVNYLECSRKKAVEIGKELARKHFIHHVFRENDFDDGNQNLYRFLEHDPAIPKYHNFIRGATNDGEPKPAAAVGQRMTKIMVAILEAYASDDRRHLDYSRIAASEEFRRYANMVQDLQRVDMSVLPAEERLPFFLNLHNAMAIHAVVRVGQPGTVDRRSSFSDFQYVVGGHPYSLATIRNGILRSNRRQPYTIAKPFGSSDKRLELVQAKVNPLVHFGLCDATRSSPIVRFFSTQGVEPELRHAAREFFLNGGVEIDLESRTVHLTRIIKWYSVDFGQDRETLKWILNYLDPTKAGLLTHLLNDGGPINISYLNYDWSLNV
uniref:DEP domain-containing protein n=1 Tax=Oryza punctata TaxID=4537 RepID=A0A0E0M8W3_ORYPU